MANSKERGEEIAQYWFEIAEAATGSRRMSLALFKDKFGVGPWQAELIHRHISRNRALLCRRDMLMGFYFMKKYPTDLQGADEFNLGSVTLGAQNFDTPSS
jgi:predicted 3-demethylubiquinone-9 3-methyltransferase (glyoxalase superfamily)